MRAIFCLTSALDPSAVSLNMFELKIFMMANLDHIIEMSFIIEYLSQLIFGRVVLDHKRLILGVVYNSIMVYMLRFKEGLEKGWLLKGLQGPQSLIHQIGGLLAVRTIIGSFSPMGGVITESQIRRVSL